MAASSHAADLSAGARTHGGADSGSEPRLFVAVLGENSTMKPHQLKEIVRRTALKKLNEQVPTEAEVTNVNDVRSRAYGLRRVRL